MLSKSLVHFSVMVGLCSLLLSNLRPTYGGDNEDNGYFLPKVPCTHCCTQCPQSCNRTLLTHTSTRDSWTLTGKSGSASCGLTAPFSWVLVCTRFVCALQESVSPALWKFCNQIPLASKVKLPRGSQSLCQIPSERSGKVGPVEACPGVLRHAPEKCRRQVPEAGRQPSRPIRCRHGALGHQPPLSPRFLPYMGARPWL